MKRALRVFWGALKDFWDELFLLMLMNIVTVLLLIPVLTFPPALAGLWKGHWLERLLRGLPTLLLEGMGAGAAQHPGGYHRARQRPLLRAGQCAV